jgi:hypothetical protein
LEKPYKDYDSEINTGFTFKSDWNGGYYYHLGSSIKRDEIVEFTSRKIEEAVENLANFMAKAFPDTDFAAWWRARKKTLQTAHVKK